MERAKVARLVAASVAAATGAVPGKGLARALDAPSSLADEHEELFGAVEAATLQPGRVGTAARALADALSAHVGKEESFVLPPLGLIASLAGGDDGSDGAARVRAIELTDELRRCMPEMLAEHRAICECAEALGAAAEVEGLPEVARLAETLLLHVRTEEQVLYPAALLVGAYLKGQGA